MTVLTVSVLRVGVSSLNRLYLTKNVRSSFKITKYILSKDICAELVRMIAAESGTVIAGNVLTVSTEEAPDTVITVTATSVDGKTGTVVTFA